MQALLKWLRRHDLTPAQLADCLGVSRATVHRWVNDGAIPTPDKMRALYRFTHGAVTPNDFYDLPCRSPVDARKRSRLPEQV